MAQRQKNSFLEAKSVEVRAGLKKISELSTLRADFDSLKSEMDNLRLERTELQEKLDIIRKKLKRWHLLWLISNSTH